MDLVEFSETKIMRV